MRATLYAFPCGCTCKRWLASRFYDRLDFNKHNRWSPKRTQTHTHPLITNQNVCFRREGTHLMLQFYGRPQVQPNQQIISCSNPCTRTFRCVGASINYIQRIHDSQPHRICVCVYVCCYMRVGSAIFAVHAHCALRRQNRTEGTCSHGL